MDTAVSGQSIRIQPSHRNLSEDAFEKKLADRRWAEGGKESVQRISAE